MFKKIFLDHGSTTPVDNNVLESMLPFFSKTYGNASSVHQFGKEARTAVEKSRASIAKIINAKQSEIYFTSGGTEADNFAIKGIAYQNRSRGNHIITSQVEHHAVLNSCTALEKDGFEVTYLPVDKFGQIDPQTVKGSIQKDTILISIIHGNNEIGTINPIPGIGQIASESDIYFHTDAVQSFGKIPIDVEKMNINLMSISAHKIYGPKGIGAIYIRNGTRIGKLIDGGSHEHNRRAGTENVPAIVGFAKAAELINQHIVNHQKSIGSLRDYFQEELTKHFENVVINGHPTERLYNNLNVSFLGCDNETVLIGLDSQGVAASTGSACSSGTIEQSHVLRALKISEENIRSAIRFTLGKHNTKEEIDYVIQQLAKILDKLLQTESLASV